MEKLQYQVMYEVEDTHFWYVGMRKITQTILSKYKFKKNSNILDAGCGTGANLSFLSRYGEIVGMDISDEAIRLCHKRGLKSARQGSINNTPFPDNSFDLVTNFDVLGSKEVDESQAIAEFYRVIKPGGHLLIRVSAYQSLYSHHDILVHTERRYTLASLTNLLAQQSFVVVRSTYANSILLPVIALRRLWQKNTNQVNSDVVPLSPWLNIIGKLPLIFESWLLHFINLPFGLSLIVVAEKPKVRI